MTLPKIGVTARFDPYSKAPIASCGVRVPFLEAIIEAGGTPVIIPLCKPGTWLDELYQDLDGILVPGGGDIQPSLFGQEPHPKTGTACELRDKIEIVLSQKCAADKKPMLGVCRGVQVQNVALGGTLIQDIPDQTKSTLNHRQATDDKFMETTCHDVTVEAGSQLAKLIGAGTYAVNSFHHQALDKLGKKLCAVAFSSDKIVEAIEMEGHPFFIGVQWHPELMWQKNKSPFFGLFTGFVKACAAI